MRLWDVVAMRCGLRIAFATVLAAALASGARADPPPCGEGISNQTAQRLFAILAHDPTEPECRFEGVRTAHSTLEARWSRAGGELPALRVVPRGCAPEPPAGSFTIDVPAEIGRACPSVLPLIDAVTAQLAAETPAGRLGSLDDPLFRATRILFVVIVLLGGGLFLRALRTPRPDESEWRVVALAAFAGALALRAALPFALGNWYAEVLPAAGPPPWMRFGPGSFALQSLLRDVGLWGPRTLIVTQLVLGAAAVALIVAILRELRIGIPAAAATAVLLIFAPFHARLSATPSEHVLAATLCLALLFAWLRAARDGDRGWFAMALLLLPAVCLTRVDMTPQALAVLPWPLLRDRVEPRRPAGWMTGMIAAVGAASAVVAYWAIALPSQHPVPDWEGYRFALWLFLPQFWLMALNDPPWLSLSSVLLTPLGIIATAARRPLLLLRITATLLTAFIVLGRSFMHDELLGARYFLFAIPIFLILPGCGFGAMVGVTPRPLRQLAAVALLAALALWTGLAARSAYAARYAFQDEYDFARTALARLPAGCVVYALPLRTESLPRDIDCCLDPRRSPLVLELPALQFRDLPNRLDRLPGPDCVAYYETVACAITPGTAERAGYELKQAAAQYFGRRCGEIRSTGRLELIAQSAVSPRTTEGFFPDGAPQASLYRWFPR